MPADMSVILFTFCTYPYVWCVQHMFYTYVCVRVPNKGSKQHFHSFSICFRTQIIPCCILLGCLALIWLGMLLTWPQRAVSGAKSLLFFVCRQVNCFCCGFCKLSFKRHWNTQNVIEEASVQMFRVQQVRVQASSHKKNFTILCSSNGRLHFTPHYCMRYRKYIVVELIFLLSFLTFESLIDHNTKTFLQPQIFKFYAQKQFWGHFAY